MLNQTAWGELLKEKMSATVGDASTVGQGTA